LKGFGAFIFREEEGEKKLCKKIGCIYTVYYIGTADDGSKRPDRVANQWCGERGE